MWAYSAKRAARDNKTLNAQENRARAVVDGVKAARTPRLVTVKGDARTLDEDSLARARRLAGLKGYPINRNFWTRSSPAMQGTNEKTKLKLV